jgi:spore maturation protein SpmA
MTAEVVNLAEVRQLRQQQRLSQAIARIALGLLGVVLLWFGVNKICQTLVTRS